MQDYPKNFSRAEMLVSNTAIRKGISNEPDSAEIEANLLRSAKYMQSIRDKLGKPIRILSCYRSPAVNKAVGGAKNSAHMKARAVDIQVENMPNKELAEFIRKNFPDASQIILEFNSWVHVEIPGNNRGLNQYITAVKQDGRTVYLSDFV